MNEDDELDMFVGQNLHLVKQAMAKEGYENVVYLPDDKAATMDHIAGRIRVWYDLDDEIVTKINRD